MQLQGKFFLIIFFIIFFSSNLPASEFGAYPSEIKIDSLVNEKSCYSINVFYDGDYSQVRVFDYWNDEKNRNLADFFKDSYVYNLDLSYEDNLIISGNKNFNFCILPKKEGKYYGVFIFEIKDSNMAIGVWVDLNIYEFEEKGNKLTGFSIMKNYSNSSFNILFIQLIFSLILLILLIYLLLKLR